MKKKFLPLIALLFSITVGLSFSPQNSYADENSPGTNSTEVDHQNATNVTEEEYLQNISGIKEVNDSELINLLKSDDSYFMLIGYKGCPYCREFSKVLSEFKETSKLPIYYVNLEKKYGDTLSSEDKQLMLSFFNEKVGPLYTPTFIRIDHQIPVNGFIGSNTTLVDLQSLNY
ncbi:PedC/BrcD family bacteriocin maturation disulfide isomerase [Candidatus Enterococcus leclercqii]|uniref:PedC/BrcD family bacteriocin maturation disulfide isomerase n=1 Tax=Enterococcus TaxID=1350 RepID=UPI00137B2FA0|nr:PedC/BrcD family bacteriocin maturation disulfide isomerase [Enterococcus sp. CU9D]